MIKSFNLSDATLDAHVQAPAGEVKLDNLRRTFTYASIHNSVSPDSVVHAEQVRGLSVDMYLAQLNADELDEYGINLGRPMSADEQVTCFIVDVDVVAPALEFADVVGSDDGNVYQFHRYIYVVRDTLAIVLDKGESFLNIRGGYLYNLRVYDMGDSGSLDLMRALTSSYLNRPKVAVVSSKVNHLTQFVTEKYLDSTTYPDGTYDRVACEYRRPV